MTILSTLLCYFLDEVSVYPSVDFKSGLSWAKLESKTGTQLGTLASENRRMPCASPCVVLTTLSQLFTLSHVCTSGCPVSLESDLEVIFSC